MKEIKKRLGKLKKLEGKADAIVVFNLSAATDPNFFYLTNSTVGGIFYYDFDKPRILTSSMEYSRAKKSWVKDVEEIGMKEFLERIKHGKTGIPMCSTSADIYLKAKSRATVDISGALNEARAEKTDYEIKCIRKACKISGSVYSKTAGEISGSITEKELKKIVEIEILKSGCEIAFPAIVAAGSNVRHPHHVAGEKKLSEPVLIDFGVKYNGYCSDVTRTIGSRFENMVTKILGELYGTIEHGVKAGELDKFVRDRLGRHAKHFITSLGHGIGLEVHEMPRISQKSSDILKAGMSFTIEPGIYVAGGIRIENDFLLKNSGAEMLTNF